MYKAGTATCPKCGKTDDWKVVETVEYDAEYYNGILIVNENHQYSVDGYVLVCSCGYKPDDYAVDDCCIEILEGGDLDGGSDQEADEDLDQNTG